MDHHACALSFEWPDMTDGAIGRDLLTPVHNCDRSELFSDDGLADLLDRYPRDRLRVYMFPPHAEGRAEALHGHARGVSGEGLLKAVKTGSIWLNLRAANDCLPEYADIARALFDPLEKASGRRTFKQDVGVLISSPNIHVHYHLDVPLVCLVQVRGEKRMWLYPPRRPFVSAEQVESVVRREREEDMEFRHEFDAQSMIIDLKPGMAAAWPQFSPHRVLNGDMMNVSLSCEFMTLPALLRANAVHANGELRRRFGLNPSLPEAISPVTLGRAALSRGLKAIRRPPERGPTPLTFRVAPDASIVTGA